MSLTDTGTRRLLAAAKSSPAKTVCWIASAIIGVLVWQLRAIQVENVRLQARYERVMERLAFAQTSPDIDLAETASEIVAENTAVIP